MKLGSQIVVSAYPCFASAFQEPKSKTFLIWRSDFYFDRAQSS